jgi:hypothetical protein
LFRFRRATELAGPAPKASTRLAEIAACATIFSGTYGPGTARGRKLRFYGARWRAGTIQPIQKNSRETFALSDHPAQFLDECLTMSQIQKVSVHVLKYLGNSGV